jgi:hypothetical protein
VLEETLLGRFVEGLRGNFKRFVLHADPKTFKDAVELAEREEYFECLMGGSRNVSAVQAPAQAPAQPPFRAPATAKPYKEILPFAVCHRCGGRGHMIQSCPSPPIPSQWQNFQPQANQQMQNFQPQANQQHCQNFNPHFNPQANSRQWPNFNVPPFNPYGSAQAQASNAMGQQHFASGPTYRPPM